MTVSLQVYFHDFTGMANQIRIRGQNLCTNPVIIMQNNKMATVCHYVTQTAITS